MAFVPVKCTNCGGEIQLDDQRENGFCAYCGSKVLFKDAIQKMELSGSISVQGIATLEKLLQNAETFHKLGYLEKEIEILDGITQNYPEDYRGWWGLFLAKTNNLQLDGGDCYSSFAYSAIKIAPESKKVELNRLLDNYLLECAAIVNARIAAENARVAAENARIAERKRVQDEKEEALKNTIKKKKSIARWGLSVLCVSGLISVLSIFFNFSWILLLIIPIGIISGILWGVNKN